MVKEKGIGDLILLIALQINKHAESVEYFVLRFHCFQHLTHFMPERGESQGRDKHPGTG